MPMTDPQALRARLIGQADYMTDGGPHGGVPSQVETDSDVWRTAAALLREASTFVQQQAEQVATLIAEREHWQSHYEAALANWNMMIAERDAVLAEAEPSMNEPSVLQAARAVLAAVERTDDATQWFDALAALRCAVDAADALPAQAPEEEKP